MYLFFDTETNGLPKDPKASHTILDAWPRLVQIAWVVYDKNKDAVEEKSYIIKRTDWSIPERTTAFHGISNEISDTEGVEIEVVLNQFMKSIRNNSVEYVIGHNIRFDRKVVASELYRSFYGYHYDEILYGLKFRDTMHVSRELVQAQGKRGIKFPKLQEMYVKLFDTEFPDAHNAIADIHATAKSYWKLVELELVKEYYKTHRDHSTRNVKPNTLKPEDDGLDIFKI